MNLRTRARSAAMRYLASPGALDKQRQKARKARRKAGTPPTVHYFHQVDDPYSHLAVQKLDVLRARYRLAFEPHLVAAPGAAYRGSDAHFDAWALADALHIADCYHTEFQPALEAPDSDAVAQANAVLAPVLSEDSFAEQAFIVGQALWAGQAIADTGDGAAGKRAIAQGDALRAQLGHYQGGMFYFEGEWFWGIDRIRSLEARLQDEGLGDGDTRLCVPEPEPEVGPRADTTDVHLEYFPSLRSPYTAIGHQRVLDLIERSGVRVSVRPVMPMLMRGIPAPRAKQRYIITDAGREGRERGTPFGKIVDPFGPPVKKAFALFPGAAAMAAELAFVTAYLNAAWFEGIDITTDQGLAQVAGNAGLDWQALHNAAQDIDWESVLDDNLQAMFSNNLWGVPSFRVTGGNSDTVFACWGQDRTWRVATEIARRAGASTGA